MYFAVVRRPAAAADAFLSETQQMNDAAINFQSEAEAAFRELLAAPGFPCVGAKAALNSDSIILRTYLELGSVRDSLALAHHLREFTELQVQVCSDYATFVAVFGAPLNVGEDEFEERLWQQLRRLNRIDAAVGAAWDPAVESDPRNAHFSFSYAGHAYYVVGMHDNSSRIARRFRWPALVFNPHEQFERLRDSAKWKHMQETIRAREIAFEGSINPMLSDFGQESEARQYSGRAVDDKWQAPFGPAQEAE
jgi:FPC/CPF motif-containing protein YcgG